MKPPKCRLCDAEHWPREPHKWPAEPKASARVKAEKPGLATKPIALATTDKPLATKHGKYADAEKRRAYQRELMRQRRAAR